ncbi:MAG: hypothetical protein AB1744_00895 [Candidatus Zixiibacteriota bacterium]
MTVKPVRVWDDQMQRYIPMHPRRALHLVHFYPTRFKYSHNPFTPERTNDMTRITDKAPLLYQRRYSLPELEGQDITVMEIEQREGDFGIYMVLRFKKGKDTGYCTTGSEAIVNALLQIDPQQDLPADLRFVHQGHRWLIE